MTTENPSNENPAGGAGAGAEQQEEMVQIEPAAYAALLDRLAELEEKTTTKVVPVSELIREAKAGQEERTTPEVSEEDLEKMSNTQLVQHILQIIDPVAVDLNTKIQTVKVMNELDKLEAMCEAVDEDFWEVKDRVYEIATKNPTLSLKEAYKLAKPDTQIKEKERKKKTELKQPGKIHALPPRPVLTGDRPGVSTTVTKKGDPESNKAAAEQAWADMEKK